MKWANEAYASKAATVRQVENRRRKHFAFAKKAALTSLRKQYGELLKRINQVQSIDGVINVIENVSLSESEARRMLESIYVEVGSDFAKYTVDNLIKEKRKSVDYYTDYMRRYVEANTGEKIKSITSTTKKRATEIAKKLIPEALKNGWGIDDFAGVLAKYFYNDAYYRSVRIARTEVIAASNAGSLQGAMSLGIAVNKVWLATKTGHTRQSHQEMDGVQVGINEYFKVPLYENHRYVGEDKMQHPGDPNGSAGNVINCRCTIVYERIK